MKINMGDTYIDILLGQKGILGHFKTIWEPLKNILNYCCYLILINVRFCMDFSMLAVVVC